MFFINYGDHTMNIECSGNLGRSFTCIKIQAKNYMIHLRIEAMQDATMAREGVAGRGK